MNHIEFLRGILASECEDCQLTSRVVFQELSHIQDVVVENHPARVLVVVFRDFLCGDSWSATTTTSRSSFAGRSRSTSSRSCTGRSSSLALVLFHSCQATT